MKGPFDRMGWCAMRDPSVRRTPRVRLVLLLFTLFFTANCLDVWATLAAIADGATELNPVMAAALALGPAVFVSAKLLLAGSGGIFLAAIAVATRAFGRAVSARENRAAWYGLCALTAVYVLLAGFHVASAIYGPLIVIDVPA
jgi:hypothetical protein